MAWLIEVQSSVSMGSLASRSAKACALVSPSISVQPMTVLVKVAPAHST